MGRGEILAVVLGLTALTPGWTQDNPFRFQWKKGEVLTYRAEHVTSVAENVGNNKVETQAHVNLLKRWHVVDVDDQGVATLHLSLAAMRNEQKLPNGEVLLFDSAQPDKSTPELREAMAKFVGQTLAIIRVDPLGRVVEVKQGSAQRYEAEPPFVAIFPGPTPKVGQAWNRTFQVTLEPPLGTGEKHEGTQRYVFAKVDQNLATIQITTQFPKQPDSPMERIPLLQKQPEGTMVFDLHTGRLHSVRLTIDQTVQEHQGANSSYQFRSVYTEEIAGGD